MIDSNNSGGGGGGGGRCDMYSFYPFGFSVIFHFGVLVKIPVIMLEINGIRW